ncbi:hypothetical protein AB0395_40105 [Streptosporangium sp. NPDC051023]|uniref:hypothetical protein n=1 Tax=Streptosporangium sp. NPDC051023 TaxID=3155410 RepID=UPI00345038D4
MPPRPGIRSVRRCPAPPSGRECHEHHRKAGRRSLPVRSPDHPGARPTHNRPDPAPAQRRLGTPLRHRLGLPRRGQRPAHAPGPDRGRLQRRPQRPQPHLGAPGARPVPAPEALTGEGATISGTQLCTQSEGESQLVANLRVLTTPNREVRTNGLPDIDGAPGGTLDGFGILADKLNELPPLLGFRVSNPIREHCFVPAVSAISVREPGTHDNLYTPISDEELEETPFHAVKLASQSDTHTLVTEELATWFLDQLP